MQHFLQFMELRSRDYQDPVELEPKLDAPIDERRGEENELRKTV